MWSYYEIDRPNWYLGYLANQRGKECENPFTPNTANWYSWNLGWNDYYNSEEYLNKQ